METSKKHRWKQALTILLAFAMICTTVSVPAYAEEISGTVSSGNQTLTWNYDTNTKTLTLSGAAEVPEDNGNTAWGQYKDSITKVVFGEGVTTIAEGAFAAYKKLQSVEWNNVTNIEGQAFEGCYALTSIEMNAKVATIGFAAFKGCAGLTSITILNGVKEISKEAFCNCTGLQTVKIYDSTDGGVNIGSRAFGFEKKENTSTSLTIVLPKNANIAETDDAYLHDVYASFYARSNIQKIYFLGDITNNSLTNDDTLRGLSKRVQLYFDNSSQQCSKLANYAKTHSRYYSEGGYVELAFKNSAKKLDYGEKENRVYEGSLDGIITLKDDTVKTFTVKGVKGDKAPAEGDNIIASTEAGDIGKGAIEISKPVPSGTNNELDICLNYSNDHSKKGINNLDAGTYTFGVSMKEGDKTYENFATFTLTVEKKELNITAALPQKIVSNAGGTVSYSLPAPESNGAFGTPKAYDTSGSLSIRAMSIQENILTFTLDKVDSNVTTPQGTITIPIGETTNYKSGYYNLPVVIKYSPTAVARENIKATHDTITITGVSNTSDSVTKCEYAVREATEGGDWSPTTTWKEPDNDGTVTFTGLKEATNYTVGVRYAAEGTVNSSNYVAPTLPRETEVTTLLAPPDLTQGTYYKIEYDKETIIPIQSDASGYIIKIREKGKTDADYSAVSQTVTPGATYEIVKTKDGLISAPAEFTVNARPAAPTDAFDGVKITATDQDITLTGKKDKDKKYQYNYSLNEALGMEWKNALTLVDASEITFQNLIANTTYKILARIKADPENSAFASETASREVKTKGTKTEGPSVSDLFTNCDLTAAGINVKKTAGCEYLLIPAEDSENMETYKKATGWTKVESAGGNEILTLTQYCDNSGQMHSVVSGTKYKVLVRYYETEDTMASEPTTSSEARTVLLPAPNEDKGSESINFADEKFTIPNGYEISRNKDFAEGTIVTDGSAITPNTTYYIRKKANGLIPASAATAFRTPDRLEKDETLAIDYETEKITIPAGYSYSINGAAAIAVTETAAEITVSPETKIAWWKNAADGKFASEKSERTAPPRGAITKPEIKYAEETVATTALMQYSTDNGKTWNDCTANMTFAALGYGDGSKDITIQFRTAATETNYASDSVSVTIPKRADEPTGGESGSGGYQIDYKNESITVPSGYEYRETGATTWTKGPVNNISMKPGTSYEIRKSATGSAPAGAVTTVTMPTRPAAPTKDNGYSIDYSKETITPGEGYEVRKVTKPESEWSDSAEFTPGAQYEIRKKATDGKNGTTAAPAGEPATVSIPARPAAPTTGEGGLKVTNETAKGQGNGKVSGITDKMEYRIGDSGDWLPGTGADVALGVGETIQVRVKATADAPHGEEITFKGEAGPALTVTFDRQDGSKVDAKLEDIEYNKPITAPIQPTRNGYVFLGWYIDAAGTQPWNFNLEGVKTNMTLYAKWVNVTYTVGGSVMEGEGKDAKPVQNAKVTIKQGSKEVAPETSTDAEGKYSFADIPAGVYNIIVTSKDAQKNEKTMTEMVEVTADTKVKTIIMPSANVSSKLEIKGSSGIIVGGLNKEAVDNADKTGNAHVSITATIKETDESDQTEQNSIDKIKKKADKEKQADNLAYIIITVEKKVGEKDATTVAETTTLLEFRIPFITSGRKDFKVYRSHKAEGSETIDTLTTTAKDGEYIEVGNGYLIIHAKKFSTYAVGYTEDTTTPSSGGSASGGGYIPPTTGSGVTTTGSGAAKVTTAIADVKNETTTGASGKQETIAKITVSAANQRETISQAKANKSKQIVIKVSEKDIQSGAKLELSLDKSFIDSIVKDTEASLKIEMPNSAKTFTRNELAQLAASADGNTVTVDLAETGEQPTDPADKNAKIIKGVQNTDITLKSAKGKKRGILLTWTKEKGYKVDYYEIYRSTKKNSGYGKKPFFRTKDGNVTKYLNTKNVKAGKTYYYRIRGVRVVDGKKYYTEYSNKAYRATK